jgi:hypothetical protein
VSLEGLYSVEIISDSRIKESESTTIDFQQHNNEIISEYRGNGGNFGNVNPNASEAIGMGICNVNFNFQNDPKVGCVHSVRFGGVEYDKEFLDNNVI